MNKESNTQGHTGAEEHNMGALNFITGRKILPLEGAIKKKIEKLKLSLNYDRTESTDKKWLHTDKEKLPPRRHKQKRKLEYLHEQDLMFKEIAHTIYSDSNLSQSYGNPEWYPPVPEYTPPKGRKFSEQDLSNEYSETTERKETSIKTPQNRGNFGDTWLQHSPTPITLEEFEELNTATYPYIDPEKFYTIHSTLKTIQGVTIRESYSYPNIVERVKWYVTFCCTEEGNEVLGIYCYENQSAITEITELLADTPVTNEAEKNDAILFLSQIHNKLSRIIK